MENHHAINGKSTISMAIFNSKLLINHQPGVGCFTPRDTMMSRQAESVSNAHWSPGLGVS